MKAIRICIHLIQIRNAHIALNLIIAFDNPDVYLMEKGLLLLKDCSRLIDKLLHKLVPA